MDIATQPRTTRTTSTTSCNNRNRHPCDFCRYKRAACLLCGPPPCELCKRQGKECTFVEGPNKRRRTAGRYRSPSGDAGDGGDADDADEAPYQHKVKQAAAASDANSTSPSSEMESSPVEQVIHARVGGDSASPARVMTQSSDSSSPPAAAEGHHRDGHVLLLSPSSLDAEPGHNAQVIGLSGESDPYLLNLYQFDDKDECRFPQLRIRNMGADDGVPVHFMVQSNSLASNAKPGGDLLGMSEADIRAEITGMVSDHVGKRLINLFWRYVQPYFPVVSVEFTLGEIHSEPSAFPASLLAAIYGHTLPFWVFDDKLCADVYAPPSADRLFELAWMAALSQFHTPSLATVQTMLLMIQRRPTNRHVADTPFKWVMLADAVALAQCLGLNLDPADWSIPPWEKRLRRRLAWAVYVQDRWLSLNFGRSSHIQECDWDVSPLAPSDFGELSGLEDEPAVSHSHHFLHLASLTRIVSSIHQNMFSIKATRTLSKSLEASFEVARPLRIELAEWLQSHPDVGGQQQPSAATPLHGLDGNGSLRLAYITAKVAVFKALLRPKSTEAPVEARAALRTGAMAVARDMYDFLSKLGAHHLEAFWHS
ncbi:Transcriptional activator protein DAL81, partial [Colletotrichum shisoi]